MKIGLYIPCFNAEQHIGDVLESVFKQSLRPDDVLVVDDASIDRTPEIVSRYPVRIIRHAKNKGLAATRNTAIKNIHTEFIASLDADCVPESDWLKHLMGLFRSSKRAGVGGKLIETYSSTICDLWRLVHMKQNWGERSKSPRFLFGSNTVFRRNAIATVGYYNETYRNNYEDVDICNRLKNRGGTLIYEPKAVVYHRKKDNVVSLLNSHWEWNLGYYQRRNFYVSPQKFASKLKYNIYGLANRYIENDLAAGKYQLLYLDFLLVLHHGLRDLEYFIRSFAPERNNVVQNFIALNSATGKIIRNHFRNNNFMHSLYGHLLRSLYTIRDTHALEKAICRSDAHFGWSFFLKDTYARMYPFLKSFSFHLYWWFDTLEHHPQDSIKKITLAAQETEAVTAS